ncbi:MAG: hypothetical protein AAGF46_08910 [Pseudomonadota bacterium]
MDSNSSSRRKTSKFRIIASTLVALTFYTLWGVWANRDFGPQAMLLAGVTQGVFSALVTLCMTHFLEQLLAGTGSLWQRRLRAVSITTLALVLLSLVAHWLVGTEAVIMTVLPSWVFGTLYAIAYVWVVTATD